MIMGRKSSPILSLNDPSNYSFVVEWLGKRFDEEERYPSQKTIMSKPVCDVADSGEAHSLDGIQAYVRISWRVLEKKWVAGLELERNHKLVEPVLFFEQLVKDTNAWIDANFPASKDKAYGRERKKLFAATRQNKHRVRKPQRAINSLQVTFSGKVYHKLNRRLVVPKMSMQDFVRSAVTLVMDSPELFERVLAMSEVHKNK